MTALGHNLVERVGLCWVLGMEAAPWLQSGKGWSLSVEIPKEKPLS